MNLKQQIVGLRDSAARLAVDFPGAWHAESGIRGSVIAPSSDSAGTAVSDPGAPPGLSKGDYRRERLDFRQPLLEKDFKALMKRFLCRRGKLQDVIEEPWRTFGYSFAAASAGSAVPTRDQEETLDGIGHSFIYGDGIAVARLANLVAFPAVKYLSKVSEHGWACGNSWGDPETALGDWVYIVYEIGLTTGDPNLRRYYRFVSAIPFRASSPIRHDLLVGFDGEEGVARPRSHCPRGWGFAWEAALRGDLAFARLGTELTLASRIALDHLLDMDAATIGNKVFAKWRARLTSSLNDTEKNIIESLGQKTVTGEELAKRANCPFNSNFKSTLSSLRKRGVLGNASPGYFVTEAFRHLPDKGQDKGQD
jgi:hypothetical protein